MREGEEGKKGEGEREEKRGERESWRRESREGE